MNEFDKAARYQAKQDPPGFFSWLWRKANTPLVFHSWLDARRLALPVEGDLTCDTVGSFRQGDQSEPTAALIVEIQAESRRNTVDRLLAYVIRLCSEPPREPGQAELRHVGGAVVNLTGPAQPSSASLGFPGVPECELRFQILQRNLRDEEAANTLSDIAAGRTTCWLLPWIPLMQGGEEAAIIENWKLVALMEPDPRVRSTLGAFAVLFADLAGRADPWKLALEGWDMRSSQVVEEWRNEGRNEGRAEGRAEGHLEARRDDLLVLLQERFGSVPKEWVQRIQAATDVERLKAAHRQGLHIRSVDELQL